MQESLWHLYYNVVVTVVVVVIFSCCRAKKREHGEKDEKLDFHVARTQNVDLSEDDWKDTLE